jgi:hypothetical protein
VESSTFQMVAPFVITPLHPCGHPSSRSLLSSIRVRGFRGLLVNQPTTCRLTPRSSGRVRDEVPIAIAGAPAAQLNRWASRVFTPELTKQLGAHPVRNAASALLVFLTSTRVVGDMPDIIGADA